VFGGMIIARIATASEKVGGEVPVLTCLGSGKGWTVSKAMGYHFCIDWSLVTVFGLSKSAE
jgi:hypothetical protein